MIREQIKEEYSQNPVRTTGFISNCETLEEFEHNAKFQLDNVAGLISIKDYESSLIKARCLVDALEKIIARNGK